MRTTTAPGAGQARAGEAEVGRLTSGRATIPPAARPDHLIPERTNLMADEPYHRPPAIDYAAEIETDFDDWLYVLRPALWMLAGGVVVALCFVIGGGL